MLAEVFYWSYWQAITALKKGACLLKYGRRGTPKFCPFRLSNVSFVLFICRFKLILVKVCVCFKYLYLALITLSPYSFKTKLKPLIFLHFILYSFTFQRLQRLLSFIRLNVLGRTRRSLFLCFEKKKRTSNIFHSAELQCPHVFSVSLPWFASCPVES